MQGPSKGLGALITGIDDARDMMHVNDITLLPPLNDKVVNVYVTGSQGRLALINHRNGCQ